MRKLVPTKNHKKFFKELCLLIKDYEKISDFRDKDEISKMLINRLPPIINNFDKDSPLYDSIRILLVDIFKNLGIVIKFIKENE